MPAIDRNCQSQDITIEQAKSELKQLVNSPDTQLVIDYAALVQKEFAAIEQFVYDNKAHHEDIGALYDTIEAKYGIDPAPSSTATWMARCTLLLRLAEG